jgi:CelD/BcsL family acetyltransferase involved in cellulose biosynthesis
LNDELEIELIQERSALPLSPGQWNDLVRRNETNSIFQTFEWFDSWWLTFGGQGRLFFLAVRRRQEIIGFATLMLRRNRLGLRQLELAGTGSADYQDFVLPIDKASAIRAIGRFLSANRRRWDRLYLVNIPDTSSTLRLLMASADDHRLAFIEEARVRCPTLIVADEEAAVKKLISKYSMRRPHNWFSRRGSLRFRHVATLEEILAMLPRFFDQHVRRWRAAGKPSLFECPEQRKFYTTLAGALYPSGSLLFSVVEFNDEPIAFHYGFDYSKSVTWYKPSFEIAHATRSPGLLLTQQLIEDTLNRSRRELDFTIGDEPFKSRFANHARLNSHVSVYHSKFVGGVARTLLGARRSLRRVLTAASHTRSRVGAVQPKGAAGLLANDRSNS